MQKLENSARRWSKSFKFICSNAQNSLLMTIYFFQYLLDSTSLVWPVHTPPDVVNCTRCVNLPLLACAVLQFI